MAPPSEQQILSGRHPLPLSAPPAGHPAHRCPAPPAPPHAWWTSTNPPEPSPAVRRAARRRLVHRPPLRAPGATPHRKYRPSHSYIDGLKPFCGMVTRRASAHIVPGPAAPPQDHQGSRDQRLSTDRRPVRIGYPDRTPPSRAALKRASGRPPGLRHHRQEELGSHARPHRLGPIRVGRAGRAHDTRSPKAKALRITVPTLPGSPTPSR